ncbi:MAG: hemolysin family protein [Deltaproteobacteria bacterium]|nr:hemolysin family protein [Deltaproteobacteria bacterium]
MFESLWLGATIILLLILANGFFAAAEIAVIATRRTRVDQVQGKGTRAAAALGRLKDEPDRFLATVQIGITFVSTLASAIGGAGAIQVLTPQLQSLPLPYAETWGNYAAILFVVLPIAYLSLVLGELVPKSMALRFSERIAFFVALPIDAISRCTSFLVAFLTRSSNVVLRLFGGKETGSASFISEEEVKSIIREGTAKGIFDETEKELIHSVFDFADTPVRAVMVPRTEIHAIDVESEPDDVLRNFVESGFSRLPVYENELDQVLGIAYNKDILRAMQANEPIDLRAMVHPPFFVPSSLPISQLLKDLQRRRMALALVVNEYGEVEGLASLEDIIEEIVGEIRDEYDAEERGPVERLPDGSLVVSGSALLKDLQSDYDLPFEESVDYHTLAGFVLAKLKRIPRGGEKIETDGHRLTIADMEGRRILKIRVEENRRVNGGAA